MRARAFVAATSRLFMSTYVDGKLGTINLRKSERHRVGFRVRVELHLCN